MKNIIHQRNVIFFAFLILTNCGKSNLPDFNKLETIRILAFQTATPEVDPGASVTINPIISDIIATSLTYSASSCIDLGISFGAEATCENNPSKVVIATNTALTLPGAAESWTGIANSFVVNIPIQAIIFAGRTPEELFNGVNYIIEYVLTNNSGQTVRSIKRIVVSSPAKTAKNANPTTTNIFADGAPMTTLTLAAKLNVTTDLTLASAESYTINNLDGTSTVRTESLATTWFITDGKTKYFRSVGTASNVYETPDAAPTGRSAYLIAMTRDDRGGLSFVKKKF